MPCEDLPQRPLHPAASATPAVTAASAATPSSAGAAGASAGDETSAFPVPAASLPPRAVCRIVRQMIAEIVMLIGDRVQLRRDRRRTACHVRQIAMYVCHVALRISLSDIGLAFGRDRTTVGHACNVVEDRRDDPAFDDFVSAIERIVRAVFGLSEVPGHE